MAFRYEHPDGPEYGHCVELSDNEYATVKRALNLMLERAIAVTIDGDPSEAARAANDEHDLISLLNDLEPMVMVD